MDLASESTDYVFYGLLRFYSVVGHFDKYNKLIEEARRVDPLNLEILTYYLGVFTFSGDAQGIEEEYERAKALVEDPDYLDDDITYSRVFANNIVSRNSIKYSDLVCDTAKEFLDSPPEALEALHRIFTKNLSSAQFMYLSAWAAYFGDPEFAMEAIEKGFSIEASGLFFVWTPIMHGVRQLPRFKEFIREIGLVDYWEQFGWPELCHPTDNGDFECD
jgi:hypothetical protein